MRIMVSSLLALGMSAGCGEAGGPGITGDLPARFYFVAEAASGDTIDCRLSYIYEVRTRRETSQASEYVGFFGGEAYRAHLQVDGSGEVFWADAGGEFLVKVLPGDSIELGYLHPFPPGDSRFWDQQSLFAGRMGAPGLAAGEWTCQPLDTRSDTTGLAQGTWRITEEPPGACETCIP